MADFQNMEVLGLKELANALRDLPINIGRNVLRGAVNAGASVIKKQAVVNAPVSTGPVSEGHPPPGTLKKAVYQKQIRERSSEIQQMFYVGVRSGKAAAQNKRGNLDAFYWRFVEFGTKNMPAHPFLRPAFEARKEAAIEAIKAYLEKRIPIEAEKLGRK